MIYEAIVTTMNPDGTVHFAPMGIHKTEDGCVIAPFRPSTTLVNLERCGQAVINFTDDVRIFAGCLSGRRDWSTVPADHIDGARLADALSHIEVEVAQTEADEVRPRFICRQVHLGQHGPFRGFNRAQAAVVEAAILVSRLDRLPPEKIDREIEYLQTAVEKTSGAREQQAWEWLMATIEQARRVAVDNP